MSRAAVGLAALLVLSALPAAAQRPGQVDAADTAKADSAGRRTPPPDPRADSIMAVLRRLQGFVPTEYQGDTAVYRAQEGVLRLRGNATVERAGDRLTANDSIIFRDSAQFVEAYGDPTVSGRAQELTGQVLYYDLAARRASAVGARTTISQQATWFVRGDISLEDQLEGATAIYATSAQFTTCDREDPHYHFESDQIKILHGKYLVARPARLYFGKVPVFWLPFVVQSLERGRRSGMIVPRFSVNDIVRTNSNYTREISNLGWFWAINDYLGAQLTGSWRSETYTALQAQLDYNWRRQFLNGRLAVKRFWPESGGEQLHFNGSTSWRPDERTNLNFSGQYASSSRFIQDVTTDPREATQELMSTFQLSRRFDWGTIGLGADRRQSISDGDVSMTLPRLTISPKPITLFRAPTPEFASWYNNATLQWSFSGSRASTSGKADALRGLQDQVVTKFDGGISQLSFGKLNFSATGGLNQTVLQEVVGSDSTGPGLPLEHRDQGSWQARMGYQQQLVGQTMLVPNVSVSQEIRRDSLTGGDYLGGPMRMHFGAALNTALFGFFPGIGPYSAIRHRISPSMSYSYSPQAELTPEQREVFGGFGGLTQNRISLGINQTFEAKLRAPRRSDSELRAPADSVAADSAAAAGDTVAAGRTAAAAVPEQAQKVMLLSINTSPLEYDFALADSTGNGFTTRTLNNTFTSDYLRGLSIQMRHELFDRRDVNPNDPAHAGRLGRFAPRLSSLSTGFELGPNSSVVQWLGRIFGIDDVPGEPQRDTARTDEETTHGIFPGQPQPSGDLMTSGSSLGNRRGTGAGPWRVDVRYSFSRPDRNYVPRDSLSGLPLRAIDDDPVQTLSLATRFALTPNWSVNWTTDYSITDGEFGTHRLNFRRDLHRWQANFNFYKTPHGNSAFEFYVELIDNRDLKFDYRERNLGIDRPQGR